MAKQVLRLDLVAGSQMLDLIHACADGCDNADAFRTLMRRQVAPLIPHRFSVVVLGTLSMGRITMHQRIGVDHPEAFMLSAPHQLNIQDRPAVAKWLASREPLVIEAPRDRHWLSELELREIERHQMGRQAIHGRIDLSARMASYFSFAGVDPALPECDLRHRLTLITPHLHAAFTGVPCVDAELRPSSGLTAIERELLDWLAAGHSNADIARARDRSPATIRNQLHVLYGKLDVSGRAEAVAVASRLIG